MRERIFKINDDRDYIEIESNDFKNEKEIQNVIANNPTFILKDSEEDAPLLIKRELSVPEEFDGSGLWRLDHLFIDSDGTPILVEVKRSANSQIRREIVGQMLDYAVKASRYWTVDFLKSQLKERLINEKLDYKEVVNSFVSRFESEDEFWKSVKSKLRSREMKLVFVADEFPLTLISIIRFLSEEMATIDVYGVSIKCYKDMISAAIIESENMESKTEKEQWNKEKILESIGERCGDELRKRASQLFEWCDKNDYVENYGTTGSFRPKGLVNDI